jgi:hypothetical protein
MPAIVLRDGELSIEDLPGYPELPEDEALDIDRN